jgi:hypothetical protein
MSNPKAKWTILTYIAAHNNLYDYGIRSWRQIRDVGSTRDVMQGVLYDGPQGASRYIFGDPGKQLVKEDFDDFDSGDPDRLVETASWLFQKYPAEKYGLVLWSHGTGWEPEEIQRVAQQVRGDADVSEKEAEQRSASTGSPAIFRTSLSQILIRPTDQRAILFDDGSQHSLDTLELNNVLSSIGEKIGSSIELLGMDACLMGSIEVAYQVRDCARFMVASEELVPADSWPYDAIYGHLRKNPDLSGGDLAQLVTSEYEAYYKKRDLALLGADVTKVALDLSQIETISNALKELNKTLAADISSVAPAIWQAQIACRDLELHQRKHSKFDLHLWDIQSLASNLAAQGTGKELQLACEAVSISLQSGSAVLNQVHLGSWFDGIGGLSIYLPMPIESPRVTEFYPQLQFARDTGWESMLSMYHQAGKKRRIRFQ